MMRADIESAVLRLAIRDPEVARRISKRLHPDHFLVAGHGTIFSAIMSGAKVTGGTAPEKIDARIRKLVRANDRIAIEKFHRLLRETVQDADDATFDGWLDKLTGPLCHGERET